MNGIASDETPRVSSAGTANSATPQTSSPAADACASREPANSTFQPAWRTAAPSARASAPPLTRRGKRSARPSARRCNSGVQRLLHRLRLRSLDVGLLLVLLLLLVVHRLGVDRPDVVVGVVHEVVHGAHGREHRVI